MDRNANKYICGCQFHSPHIEEKYVIYMKKTGRKLTFEKQIFSLLNLIYVGKYIHMHDIGKVADKI